MISNILHVCRWKNPRRHIWISWRNESGLTWFNIIKEKHSMLETLWYNNDGQNDLPFYTKVQVHIYLPINPVAVPQFCYRPKLKEPEEDN